LFIKTPHVLVLVGNFAGYFLLLLILLSWTWVCKLYSFLWVIPRLLNLMCRRFGTHCLFHPHRSCEQDVFKLITVLSSWLYLRLFLKVFSQYSVVIFLYIWHWNCRSY
jgi:hypothetical protein